MRTRGRSCGTIAIGIVVSAGCGGSTTPHAALDPVTFAERYCALYAPCCTDLGVAQAGSCRVVTTKQATLAGKLSAKGEICLEELRARFDGFGFCNFQDSKVIACDEVLGMHAARGSVPLGGVCRDDPFSCAPSTQGDVQCALDYNMSEFRCQAAIPHGAPGQGPCIGTVVLKDGPLVPKTLGFEVIGYTCAVADGVYCDSFVNTCAPLQKNGEACNAADTGSCVSNDCIDSVCRGAAIGTACEDGFYCVDGAYCDTGYCLKRKPPGAACRNQSNDCAVGQCTDGICVPPWTAFALGYLCD